MRRAVLTAASAATLALLGCGSKAEVATSARPIEVLPINLPDDIVGLKVRNEDIAGALKEVRPSYVRQAALFSLRSPDDLVQATLQVSRFRDERRYKTSGFRRTIINQLGSSTPRETRMGEHTVWRTSGSKLALAVWFEGDSMYLLSIRDDFDRPRTLIRTFIDMRVTA